MPSVPSPQTLPLCQLVKLSTKSPTRVKTVYSIRVKGIQLMRLFFVALFVILGANLGIELLDSNMTQIIKERNESIQRSINNL